MKNTFKHGNLLWHYKTNYNLFINILFILVVC